MTGTALDRMPPPPSAKLLGWTFVAARPQDGWLRVGFEARPEFLNPAGAVQGGILTAMLDDTVGPVVFIATEGRQYTVTVDLHVAFMAPAHVGPLFCEAQILQLGSTIGFVEGRLMDEAGKLLVRATATQRLISGDKLPPLPAETPPWRLHPGG